MTDYAVARTPLGAVRVYMLFPRQGTAEIVTAVGAVATPARYEGGTGGAPLRLLLEDGRSFLVKLRTCDECAVAFDGVGLHDGFGNLFCGSECRDANLWRAR